MVPDFLQLESSILAAVMDRRWDRLGSLLDDDFVITTAGWLDAPATKEVWIDEVSTRHDVHEFDIHSVDVHDMGNVAVVLVLSTQWATWKDSPFKGTFRYTDVWRLGDSGNWRLAVRHASLVSQS
jgi:ketosteroid isomerase-like protein